MPRMGLVSQCSYAEAERTRTCTLSIREGEHTAAASIFIEGLHLKPHNLFVSAKFSQSLALSISLSGTLPCPGGRHGLALVTGKEKATDKETATETETDTEIATDSQT